jgi:hypothetical protein
MWTVSVPPKKSTRGSNDGHNTILLHELKAVAVEQEGKVSRGLGQTVIIEFIEEHIFTHGFGKLLSGS